MAVVECEVAVEESEVAVGKCGVGAITVSTEVDCCFA